MRLEGRSEADAYVSMGENQYLRKSDHSTRFGLWTKTGVFPGLPTFCLCL
jgi:hypothetical protein